jgi:hypothetical protein
MHKKKYLSNFKKGVAILCGFAIIDNVIRVKKPTQERKSKNEN